MIRFLGPALILAAAASLGCGVYTFSPAGKSNIQAIAVERFENKTTEFELADRMTDLVIDAFLADGTFKVVSAENADATLSGVLARYDRKPFEYFENDVVLSYSVTLTFDIALTNPSDNDTEIWRETMIQEGVYLVDGQTEQEGQNIAVERLIVSIVNRTTKSW
jgi:hypothetical protein